MRYCFVSFDKSPSISLFCKEGGSFLPPLAPLCKGRCPKDREVLGEIEGGFLSCYGMSESFLIRICTFFRAIIFLS